MIRHRFLRTRSPGIIRSAARIDCLASRYLQGGPFSSATHGQSNLVDIPWLFSKL